MTSESIQVLIKYEGTWDEHGTYENYKATGMLLPCDSDYKALCKMQSKNGRSQLTETGYKFYLVASQLWTVFFNKTQKNCF